MTPPDRARKAYPETTKAGQVHLSFPDYDPFDRPLFNDPDVRHLKKVAVLDVGSNSVRLVVFDGAARSPAYFFNEKVMCALGAGLSSTGKLNPQGRIRALKAIARFQVLAQNMDIPKIFAVATAAVRDAEDGPDFVREVLEKTGQRISVIDGLEEARLSAQGVLLGWPQAEGLMCDIGGSSMELAVISNGQIGKRVTSDLGPLKLMEIQDPQKRSKFIAKTFDKLAKQVGAQHKTIFLVGGSWRAIASIDMERRAYPLQVLHEYAITPENLEKTIDYINVSDPEELRKLAGVSQARMDLVPLATEVLAKLTQTFSPETLAVSSFGIREGLLYEQMPQKLRDRDPLLEGAKFNEQKDARSPGFGKILFRFVSPLFPDMPRSQERLVRAACHLHDVNWRALPEFRPEVCFDSITRSSLSGLSHDERVFVGLSMMHRYRSKGLTDRFEDVSRLLSEEQLFQAEILGRAMRLGAMLWATDTKDAARLKWDPDARNISLLLSRTSQILFGEVAEARFASLATALSATSQVQNQ